LLLVCCFLIPKNICLAKIFGKKEQSLLGLTIYRRKWLTFMRIATRSTKKERQKPFFFVVF
jgi:hypothetical protein